MLRRILNALFGRAGGDGLAALLGVYSHLPQRVRVRHSALLHYSRRP